MSYSNVNFMKKLNWIVRVKAMVFNTPFNNISFISYRSVLLVEKTTDHPQVTDKLDHISFFWPCVSLCVFLSSLMEVFIIKTSCVITFLLLHIYIKLTFKFHTNIQTFLKSTKWTSFPLSFIYQTTSIIYTWVHFLILYSTLEKTYKKNPQKLEILSS